MIKLVNQHLKMRHLMTSKYFMLQKHALSIQQKNKCRSQIIKIHVVMSFFSTAKKNIRVNIKELQKNVAQLRSQQKEIQHQKSSQISQKSQKQIHYINALQKLAQAYESANQLQKNVEVSSQLLKVLKHITKKQQHQTSLQIAQICKVLQILNCKLKQFKESIPFLQTCIKIKQNLYGEESLQLAKQNQDLAMIYYYLSDFSNSIKFNEIALNIREKQPNSDYDKNKENQIKILDYLSYSYFILKKYQKADQILSELILKLASNKTKNIVKLIDCYVKQSSVKMYLKRHEQTLQLLKKALSLVQLNPSEKYYQIYSLVYKEICRYNIFIKDFKNAEEFSLKQFQLLQKVDNSQKMSKLILQNLTMRLKIYEQIKDYQKSKQILLTLIQQKKNTGNFDTSLIKNLIFLGKIYKHQNSRTQAKLKFAQALSLLSDRSQNQQIKFQKGDMYYELAQIYFQESNFQESIKNYQMAKQMLEALNNQNFNYVLADVYVNLAKIQYFILKKVSSSNHSTDNLIISNDLINKSVQLLTKAQNIYETIKAFSQLSMVSQMIAAVLMDAKKYDKSLQYGKKALSILQNSKQDKSLTEYKIGKGTLLNQLGKISFQLKNYSQAQKYLTMSQRLLNQTRQSQNYPLGEMTQSVYILSQLYKLQNKKVQCLQYLKKLSVLLQANLQLSNFPEIKLQLDKVKSQIQIQKQEAQNKKDK